MGMVAFSLAPYSKVAHARVLLDSLKAQHNEIRTFLVIVERHAQDIEGYGHEFVKLEQLDVPEALAFQYEAEELQEALKPWALAYFLRNFGSVLFCDPEGEFFSPLTGLASWMNDYEAVVVPNVLAPLPDDGLLPGNSDVLRTGLFHAGFFAMRASSEVDAFIQYWKEAVCQGLVGWDPLEQWTGNGAIFSSIGSYVGSLKIVRSRSVHFSSWSASQRSLSCAAGQWMTADGPLVSVHFRGFGGGVHTRPFVSPDGVHQLLAAHALKVAQALRPFPGYSFGCYMNGELIWRSDRRAFFHMSSFEKRNLQDPFRAQDEMRKRYIVSALLDVESVRELVAIKKGPSWKIGRAITWPLRHARAYMGKR